MRQSCKLVSLRKAWKWHASKLCIQLYVNESFAVAEVPFLLTSRLSFIGINLKYRHLKSTLKRSLCMSLNGTDWLFIKQWLPVGQFFHLPHFHWTDNLHQRHSLHWINSSNVKTHHISLWCSWNF